MSARDADGTSEPRGARPTPITSMCESTAFSASYVCASSASNAGAAASSPAEPNCGRQNRLRFGSLPTTSRGPRAKRGRATPRSSRSLFDRSPERRVAAQLVDADDRPDVVRAGGGDRSPQAGELGAADDALSVLPGGAEVDRPQSRIRRELHLEPGVPELRRILHRADGEPGPVSAASSKRRQEREGETGPQQEGTTSIGMPGPPSSDRANVGRTRTLTQLVRGLIRRDRLANAHARARIRCGKRTIFAV